MKLIQSVGMVLIAAAIAVGIWWLFRDDALRRSTGGAEEDRPAVTRPETAPAAGAAATRAGFDWTRTVPGWIPGEGLPAAPGADRILGAPMAVRELAAMTRGLPAGAAGSLAVKEKVGEIAFLLDEMSDEELAYLAEAFRASEDPAFKYQMLVAFHLRGASPVLVDAVADYYESEPNLVGDVLQQIAARDPESGEAVRALQDLLERAVEPQERELLLSRLAIAGRRDAVATLHRALDAPPGSNDRRIAVQALARLDDEASRARLTALIDGDREEAHYPPTVPPPVDPIFRDLRAHAVNAMLVGGAEASVRDLLGRIRDEPDSDVARYALELLPVAQDPRWIPDVVALALDRGRLDDGVFGYLHGRARTEDIPQIERLRGLDLEPERRRQLDELLARLN